MTTEELESKRTMNINWELPPHILQVILSKLPMPNFPICRAVCKLWDSLILDYSSRSKSIPSSFLLCIDDAVPNLHSDKNDTRCNFKMHCIDVDTMSSVTSFEFNNNRSIFNILDSCNGLMAVLKDSSSVGILNLMTNQYFDLCVPMLDDSPFGFGFSPKTKEYKLFEFSFSNEPSICCTLGRGGFTQWRRLNHSSPFTIYSNCTYFNGVIYWVGIEIEKIRAPFLIYSLDVESEKIESIPTFEVGLTPIEVQTQVFNSTVYAIFFNSLSPRKVDVWKMESKDSWIRQFVIVDLPYSPSNSLFHLVKAFEDGGILYMSNEHLFYLDKTGRKTKIKRLVSDQTRIVSVYCLNECMDFRSLPNILNGDY